MASRLKVATSLPAITTIRARGIVASAAALLAAAAFSWVGTSPNELPAQAAERQRRFVAGVTVRAAAVSANGAARIGEGEEKKICRLLDASGICVVEGFLPASALRYLGLLAESVWVTRGNVVYGRVHSNLMDAPEREATENLVLGLLPLVDRFFATGAVARERFRWEGSDGSAQQQQQQQRGWYLSQLQLVDALPGCTSQFWHVDNTARGLTIIIPLVPTTATNGPTELFPLSHCAWLPHPTATLGIGHSEATVATTSVAIRNIASGFILAPVEWMPIRATVGAGAAIIYDSRTLHRGRANSSNGRRPALVLRYDLLATPPPGIGPVATSAVRIAGQVVERCGATKV